MRIAQLLALSGLMLATSVTAGGELDRNDVPNGCWEPCGPVVNISHACDAKTDNDRAELQCVCQWDRAATLIPLCEACIGYYRTQQHHDADNDDDDDDDDNDNDDDNDLHDNGTDAYDILTSCSLSTTTWNPAAATSVLSAVNASATGNATGTGVTGRDSATGSGGSSGATDRADSVTATGAVSAEGARVTDNAAPGVVAAGGRGAASFAAVVGVGVLVLL
ncbi:hypothetical protein BO99DRAFT_453463 [Aspergillus violaceofuscus CBS 115571]|uniref:GPI anchored protein n=1 Tax=Aspergillus violaceofuscus (strain CBS 115571) TaxID=1450538 RepID=A0A2V5INM3_ASPV1|nr:hypothetical protein BO99DRAFT_453463 [Aspergillus violaceofuscus CBS 115571]